MLSAKQSVSQAFLYHITTKTFVTLQLPRGMTTNMFWSEKNTHTGFLNPSERVFPHVFQMLYLPRQLKRHSNKAGQKARGVQG